MFMYKIKNVSCETFLKGYKIVSRETLILNKQQKRKQCDLVSLPLFTLLVLMSLVIIS